MQRKHSQNQPSQEIDGFNAVLFNAIIHARSNNHRQRIGNNKSVLLFVYPKHTSKGSNGVATDAYHKTGKWAKPLI